MTYAFVNDVPASWDAYEKIVADVGDEAPAGLIAHVAGPTDEGFRIIDVWESEQAYRSFQRERLQAAVAVHVPRVGRDVRPVFRDLHVRHAFGPAFDFAGNQHTERSTS